LSSDSDQFHRDCGIDGRRELWKRPGGRKSRAVLERLQLKARTTCGTPGAGLGFLAPVPEEDSMDEHAGFPWLRVFLVHLERGNATAVPMRAYAESRWIAVKAWSD
jgi:hypothetical protein